MIHFDWLWAAALLPLPWIVRWVFPKVQPVQDSALRVPAIDDFICAGVISIRRSMVYVPLILAMLAWVLAVLALTRPQWLDIRFLPKQDQAESISGAANDKVSGNRLRGR